MSISGIVITINEEKNIKDCLMSLRAVCDELIVVDSGSQDRTLEIARSLGAKCFTQSYLGDGLQKNFGIQHACNKWILSLDADERLSDEAIVCLKQIDFKSAEFEAFALKRKNFIGKRWIRYGGWYPDYCVRLFNKEKTKWQPILGHSRVESNKVKKLNGDIIHYSYDYSGQLFVKGDRFSSRAAKELYKLKRSVNAFSPILHGLSAFFRLYFLKWGFLGGLDGLTVALSSGISTYLKYAKLIELNTDQKTREALDLDKIW